MLRLPLPLSIMKTTIVKMTMKMKNQLQDIEMFEISLLLHMKMIPLYDHLNHLYEQQPTSQIHHEDLIIHKEERVLKSLEQEDHQLQFSHLKDVQIKPVLVILHQAQPCLVHHQHLHVTLFFLQHHLHVLRHHQ